MAGTHPHTSSRESNPNAATAAQATRALLWTLGLNFAFLIIEASAGFITGSLALLSDAAHMVSDVAALALALLAQAISRRPATPSRTFGLQRAEVVGAFVNGLALVGVAGYLVYSAVERMLTGVPEVAAGPVFSLGLIGLAINVGSAAFLWRSSHGNLNLRGALWHMLADALGSVGAMIAGVGMYLGVYVLDAIAALLIAALVIVGTIGLLRDTLAVLLLFAPGSISPPAVRSFLMQQPKVDDVHDLHVWSLDGRRSVVSAHIVSEVGALCPHDVRDVISRLEEEFGVQHVTLQHEVGDQRCAGDPCSLVAPLREAGHAH